MQIDRRRDGGRVPDLSDLSDLSDRSASKTKLKSNLK